MILSNKRITKALIIRAGWSDCAFVVCKLPKKAFLRRGPYRFLMDSLTSQNFMSPSYEKAGVDLVQKFKTKSENMNDKKVILV